MSAEKAFRAYQGKIQTAISPGADAAAEAVTVLRWFAMSPEPMLAGEAAETGDDAAGGLRERARVALRIATAGDRNSWMLWVLRGGADDGQGGTGAGAGMLAERDSAIVVQSVDGSELSAEDCRALGVPLGSRWGVAQQWTVAAGASNSDARDELQRTGFKLHCIVI